MGDMVRTSSTVPMRCMSRNTCISDDLPKLSDAPMLVRPWYPMASAQ